MVRRLRIPLDSNIGFAEQLGRLMGYWAIAEHEMIGVLGWLLGVSQRRAQLVFMSFISTRGKIDLIARLSYMFLDDGPEKASLIKLLDEAATLNSERNRFVHATWAAGKTSDSLTRFENSLTGNLKNSFKPHAELTAQDVENVVDNISRLCLGLQDFQRNVAPRFQVREQPLA